MHTTIKKSTKEKSLLIETMSQKWYIFLRSSFYDFDIKVY